MSNPSQKRIGQVFGFLDALNQLRNQPVKVIEDQPWVLRIQDVPDHPSIIRATIEDIQDQAQPEESKNERIKGVSSDFILRVKRPALTKPPSPPDSIKDWLQTGWEKIDSPANVHESRNEPSPSGEAKLVRFNDDPRRLEEFGRWSKERDEWASNERPAREAMALFERLYELHGKITREGERFELIVGDGLLSWRRPEGGILHPILLKRIQLQFDADIPEFTLVETGTPTEIYSALFRAMKDVDGRLLAQCREEMEKLGCHPLGEALTSGFLKKFAQLLSPNGQFSGEFPVKIETDFPRISRCPFVFLRSRTLGFAMAIEAILEDIKRREDFPQSLLSIVGDPADAGQIDPDEPPEDDVAYSGNEDESILLSKPANSEQLQLAQRLKRHDCVVVQGPPGTGKTHTIANLLGHLLAQGKSVLVTSHTSKALRVLREKVVEALQPLCVSVLESDLDSRKQLESSIAQIVERLTSSDYRELERQANRLSEKRSEILNSIQEVRQNLLNARSGEYREVVVAGQSYSPSAAARLVTEKSKEDSWIPSPVRNGAPLPLTDEELIELYQTNRAFTLENESELALKLPELSSLPHPSDFRRTVALFQKLTMDMRDVGEEYWVDRGKGLMIPCEKCGAKNRMPTQSAKKALCGKCKTPLKLSLDQGGDDNALDPARLDQLIDIAQQVAGFIPAEANWQGEAIMAGWKGGLDREPWDNLLAEIDSLAKLAAETKEQIMRFGPAYPESENRGQIRNLLEEIDGHFATGGSISFWQLLLRPKWKRLVESSLAEGGQPRTRDHFRAIHARVRLDVSRDQLLARWERMISPSGGLKRETFGAAPEVVFEQFRAQLVRLLNWHSENWAPIASELTDLGLDVEALVDAVPPITSSVGPLLRIRETALKNLPRILAARANKIRIKATKAAIDSLSARFPLESRQEHSGYVTSLQSAIRQLDADAYSSGYERLKELLSKRTLLERRQALLAKLEGAAPAWASVIRLRQSPHDTEVIPGNVPRGWLWRQLHDELEERNKVSAEELQNQLDGLLASLQSTTSDLIEARAWRSQVKKTTHSQRNALTGWVETIRRIGKGTGRRAPRLEIEARKLMTECRSAVPVWIMPLSRVVENFDPRRNRFDVVIVDEASQLDVMGLIAMYMADQVVIVGDHEQVSPEAVGQNQDEAQHLIDEHLGEIPLAHLYDGKFSVYDLAKTAFGGQLCLKEHFRCVEEIIQFSNHLCYHGQIRPLRDSSAAKTLPHVVEYRVSGTCDRNNVNWNEAMSVASLVAAAIKQIEYKDKTFGVISLLGDAQAREIDALLRHHLSPALYEERRIVCGNAAHFQGDERDVMLLSVVDSSQEQPLRFRDEPIFRKRFNVAASRAKDQMWVVHSLDAERDLQPSDLRRRLIEHARDPMATVRLLEKQSERVQSEFERQVLIRLVDAGFKVTPQWKAGCYSIDLVVEGKTKRLAVECDGDRYHTLENLDEDMVRQSVLERLGWKFIRIRGSRFFRFPDDEIARIEKRLNQMGIERLGTPAADKPAEPPRNLPFENIVRTAEEIRRTWLANPGYIYEEQLAKRRSTKAPFAPKSEPPKEKPRAASPANASHKELQFAQPQDGADSLIVDAIHKKLGKTKMFPDFLAQELLGELRVVLQRDSLRKDIRNSIEAELRAGRLQSDHKYIWRKRP